MNNWESDAKIIKSSLKKSCQQITNEFYALLPNLLAWRKFGEKNLKRLHITNRVDSVIESKLVSLNDQ